jgi:hypothetical protein
MERRLLGFAAVWLGLMAGCPFSFTNEEHCAAQEGDATCAAEDPSRPYCALDSCGLYNEVNNRTGCVAVRPERTECYSPCGGKLDADERSDCEAGTEATTEGPGTGTDMPSSTMSTTETPDTDPDTTDGCACEGETPVCVDGECMPCTDDDACVAAVGEGLVCYAGRCVPCAPTTDPLVASRHKGCSADAPNCIDDACSAACLLPEDCDSQACDPEKAECAPQGCDLRRGLCGPSDRTFYVSSVGLDSGDGSRESPFATIGRALMEIPFKAGPNDVGIGTILLAPGVVYEETLAFAGKSVILRPSGPGEPPVIRSSDDTPVFTLLSESKDSPEQAVLYLDHVRVEGTPGPVAVLGRTTRFFADGAELFDNAEGIRSNGAFTYLRNTVVGGTVGPVYTALDESNLDIEASTIIDNQAALWIDCSGDGTDTIVGIRDSIFGLVSGPEFSTLLSEECMSTTARSVLGDVGSADDYRDGYRLDLSPDEMFRIEGADVCELGVSEPPGDQLCAPRLDIDGNDRSKQNWAGASVP